ncbi:MAG TPA: glycosyltransferase [archaeon]|nr:glycosyltransferase [archaeon]
MRIYYASQSFYPYIGGVSTYLLNLARSMVENANEVVEVHLRPFGEENYAEVKGVEVHRVPKEPIEKDVFGGYYAFKEAVYSECHYNTRAFGVPAEKMPGFEDFSRVNEYFGTRLRELLEYQRADIVHIHDFQLLFAYKYVPRGTPLVLTWHIPFAQNMSKKLSRFLVRHLKQYDRVVFSTQDYIDAAVGAGFPAEKAELIYPITDTNIFRPMTINLSRMREKYGIPKKAKVILSAQRIDQKSGHEQLIRAMPKILEKVPNAALVFVGAESLSNKISKEREELNKSVHSLIDELGLGKKVFFMGNVDYAKMPEVYNCADIVALCSKNEGFGLSITEGMSCGKPLVATNVGGLPIQVKNGRNGFLVEYGDYAGTALKICRVLLNTDLAGRMSRSSLAISQKFSLDTGIERHMALYTRLRMEKDEVYRLDHFEHGRIRAIITDFDRTITDRAAKARFDPDDLDFGLLREMKATGIDLVLATGRPFSYAEKFCRKFRGWNCVIAENGAVIYIPSVKRTITISTRDMKRARKIILKMGLEGTVAGDVIVSVKAGDWKAVSQALGGLIERLRIVRNVDDVLVLPLKVDKGYGIRLAMQYLNIDMERTVVVGDGENDVDMFMNPGYKIALANSHPRLKRLANEVLKKKSLRGMRLLISRIRRLEEGARNGRPSEL